MSDYVLAPAAVRDLREIWNYIAVDSPDAADRVVLKLREAARKLCEMPGIGHVRSDLPDPSLRAWKVYSYLIIYKPDAKPLEIVRIVHGMRDIPNIF